MHFLALATDYDDTIASDGTVDPATLRMLLEVKRSGRKLVLVTGRELPDLESVFPQVQGFDIVVAENGALLFDPLKREEIMLAPPPDPEFVRRLQQKRVTPLSIGRTIVATRRPHEIEVLATIAELGLELQITFNKGAVMVLPPNVNKATGLAVALDRLGVAHERVVGVGDAENDHAFLEACGCSAAVANALPSLKEHADIVLHGERGAGVAELASLLIEYDLATDELARLRR